MWTEPTLLEGVVESLELLEAPLSGRPCVLYEVALTWVQRLREPWTGNAREVAGCTFVIRVAEEQVLVDASRAEVHLRRPVVRRVRAGRDLEADRRLSALYQRLARPWPARRVVACREGWLAPGEGVRVAGTLVLVPDARGRGSGYREPPRLPLLQASEVRAA